MALLASGLQCCSYVALLRASTVALLRASTARCMGATSHVLQGLEVPATSNSCCSYGSTPGLKQLYTFPVNWQYN